MPAPALRIELAAGADGGAVLRCVRADGSVTWQRHEGPRARFFPLHDLTHLAVESALGARQGFFGLVAAGWDIADTTGRGARGPLPDEALAVEQLVGLLDTERATGAAWTADEVNAQAAAYAAAHGRPAPRPLTDADLARVRAERDALHARWHRLAPDERLLLRFDPSDAAPGA